ncbi:hypothetical protein MBLNU230_g5273t1 [Neophaeotheca triangularis]
MIFFRYLTLSQPQCSLRVATGLETCSANFHSSFFKTLVDKQVTIELKNDISIRGTLKSIDQFLNLKLDDVNVTDEYKYPHLSSVKNVFIRGSTVRYIHLPPQGVDTALLEDATRKCEYLAASRTRPDWHANQGMCALALQVESENRAKAG